MRRCLFALLSSVAFGALTLAASAQTTSSDPQIIHPAASTASPNFGAFYATPFVSFGDSNDIGENVTLAADFNHDGKPDIASIGYLGSVTMLLNNGHGGFLPPIISLNGSWSTNAGDFEYPLSIPLAFAADFNGDGYPDLVLGAPNISQAATIVVRLNQKDGSFGPMIVLPLPNPNYGTSVEYSAFNIVQNPSSKYMDIVGVEQVFASGGPQLLLTRFVNNGSGSFTAKPAQTITLPTTQTPYVSGLSLSFADLDQDGNADLLLELDGSSNTPTKYVDVLLGNSDGTFQQPTSSSVVFTATPIDIGGATDVVHVQSLTGDPARLDLIMNLGESVQVSLSNGDGTFQAPKSVLQTLGVTQLLLADLNGDGKIDLIASGGGSLISYLGKGDGTFGPATGTTVAHGYSGFESVLRTALADFDGDGNLDFANGDYYGHLELGRGNGDGTFISTPLIHSNTPLLNYSVNFAVSAAPDLNGDGIPDLIGYGASSIVTGLSTGKGSFTFQAPFSASSYPIQYVESVVGDFNGDGKQDVILVRDDGTAAAALSNGDGTLKISSSVITPAIKPACPLGNAAIGDLNGDGKQDIVFVYQGDSGCGGTTISSGYFVVLGNGDGTFQTPVFQAQGTALYALALDSFHGKNQPLDLVVTDFGYRSTNSSVSILKGNGDGTFASAVVVKDTASLPVVDVLTDDFNQDGKADLTLVFETESPTSAGASLYSGNGDGTFTEQEVLGVGTISANAIYADVNGDGVPDFIGNSSTGLLSVYLGTGQGNFGAPIQYFFDSISEPLFAGRFLGDNAISIVGTTDSSGSTAFFMNQGGTAFTVQPSTTSVISGESITINAGLTATLGGQPAPTGTITYYDGSTQLGNAAIGTPLGDIQLALGTHQITAKYSGDTHFNPNTSAAVTVTVASPPPAPDFTFTSSGTSLNISKGSTGTLTFNVAANSSLSATVAFQCTGLPSESTCVFSPSSLTVSAGGSGSTTLTIGTKAASAVRRQAAGDTSKLPVGAFVVAGLLVFFIPRRRLTRMMMLIVVSLATLTVLSGCGGGSSSTTPISPVDPGTPTGTSSVTVTATGISGGTTISHTVVISLKVQ